MNKPMPVAYLSIFREDGDERLTRKPRTDLTDGWDVFPLYREASPRVVEVLERLINHLTGLPDPEDVAFIVAEARKLLEELK